MSVSHCYELMHQLFKIFVPYAYFLVLQVSIARVHPISATTSYKTTLKKVDFTEEEYTLGLHLPNVGIVKLDVEQLISILQKAFDF